MDPSAFDLRGQAAVVTGGTSGIGKAIALGLSRAGARVTIAGSDPLKCERAAEDLRRSGVEVLAVPCDVTRPESVAQMFERAVDEWGRVRVLVNSAGVSQAAPALEKSPEEWRRVLTVDLDGAFFCCQAAARSMVGAGKGAIINVTSISGLLGYADQAAYCAAKGGLTMLTRALAVEWAKHGIRVNAIAPTWFYSSISAHILDDPAQLTEKLKSIPLGRVGRVEDVAGVAVFLASDAAGFVSGQVLAVDGGKFALLGEW
jgi:NAD(P)-dependent dehydrogenase (short-subunit alcohol dehydrogenase family)